MLRIVPLQLFSTLPNRKEVSCPRKLGFPGHLEGK